jgi:hypothetical protein
MSEKTTECDCGAVSAKTAGMRKLLWLAGHACFVQTDQSKPDRAQGVFVVARTISAAGKPEMC